jgi:hypothetical protein
MQFIPSTWVRWARDGNGDGRADPNNIYDAALAAASYLCHAGPMTDDAGLLRAFLSYNHSDAYAHEVLGFAKGYSAIVIPAPPAPDADPTLVGPPPAPETTTTTVPSGPTSTTTTTAPPPTSTTSTTEIPPGPPGG